MRKGFKKVFKRWPPRDFCVSLEAFAFNRVILYMATEDFQRELTAAFSADVVGNSCLMGEDEPGTVSRLEEYRQVMTSHIERCGGRVGLCGTTGRGTKNVAAYLKVMEGAKRPFRYTCDVADQIDSDK